MHHYLYLTLQNRHFFCNDSYIIDIYTAAETFMDITRVVKVLKKVVLKYMLQF